MGTALEYFGAWVSGFGSECICGRYSLSTCYNCSTDTDLSLEHDILRATLKYKKKDVVLAAQFLFIAAVSLISMAAVILAKLYHLIVAPSVINLSIILPRYRNGLMPEHDERFVFLSLGVVVPVVLLIICVVVFRGSLQDLKGNSESRAAVTPIAIAVLFIFLFAGFEFSGWLRNGIYDSKSCEQTILILIACFVSALFWYFLMACCHWTHKAIIKTKLYVVWAIFFAAMLLQVFSWRIVGSNSITNIGAWHGHVDAVIYALSQVIGGKTILADLPSQYGLFPEILAPLFKVFGLSILSFSIVCAVMQITSMTSVMYVLQRQVRDPAIKVVSSIAFVMITFETCLWAIGVEERYFQYWPIRFFWPALSVLAFYHYSQLPTLRRALLVSIAGTIGALWNIDSGIMIEMAFAAFLLSKLALLYGARRHEVRNYRLHLLSALSQHLAVGLLIVTLFFFYLALKSSLPIHLAWLYEYQRIFYDLGFMMLPMPLFPHAWMVVLGVYLIGIIVAFSGLAQWPCSKSMDNILFLCLLGFGLFIYYQGRSHVLNLITVAWPALIVASILADRVVRAVKAQILCRVNLVLPAAALAILMFCALPFILAIPRFYGDALSVLRNRNVVKDRVVHDEINFIRSHSSRGQVCAILSLRQGIYYAETGLVSPLLGPGYVETVLQSDLDNMINQIKVGKPSCIFLGLGASAIDLGGREAKMFNRYKVYATSSQGTMQLLLLK